MNWDVAEAMQPLGNKVQVEQNLATLVQDIVAEAQAGDHILVMSNGGFGGIHQLLLDALTQKVG